MSKLYDKYLLLKEKNHHKLYLFKSGNFYIFLGEDCELMVEFFALKQTKFCKESNKCGFPISSLDKYMHVFKNHNLDVELIEEKQVDNKEIIKLISKLDINQITPLEALKILENLKEKIHE